MSRLIHSAAMAGVGAAAMTVSRGRTDLSAFEGCEAARCCANWPAVRLNATAADLRSSIRRSPMRNASAIRSNTGAATAVSAGRSGEPLAVLSVPRDWYTICVASFETGEGPKRGVSVISFETLGVMSAPRLRQAVISFETLADLV